MILKSVIHYPETNSVEATWVDADGNQLRCHSYADVQMDMLQADLGDDAAQYADLIATVTANIKPPAPPSPEVRKSEIIASLADIDRRRIRPLAEGDTSFLAVLNAQAIALRTELAGMS